MAQRMLRADGPVSMDFSVLDMGSRTYIDDDGIESNDIHGMLVVAINDITGQRSVSNLETCPI
jgi:hypothetical protein